jgi:hypothetical protein
VRTALCLIGVVLLLAAIIPIRAALSDRSEPSQVAAKRYFDPMP